MEIDIFTKDEDDSRRVLKIKEYKDSKYEGKWDLNITFPSTSKIMFSSDEFNIFDDVEKSEYTKLQESHISIHHTSPEKGYAFIKKTKDGHGVDDNDKTHVHLNPSVLRDKLFAPVNFRVFGKLIGESYDFNPLEANDQARELVGYNSNSDTLVVMLVLSKKGILFPQEVEHPSNILRLSFNDFEITIIHSLFNFEPLEQSLNYFPYTKREDFHSIGACNHLEIYDLYTDHKMAYAKRYFEKKGIE